MLTEQELRKVLSEEIKSMTGEPFNITYYILDQIVENFRRAGLINEQNKVL